jgi:iron(III) transport system ATP-binding protein
MIRPDDIDFLPDDRGDAVIVDREFRGSENIFRIRLRSGIVVRSSQPSTMICPPGQHVRLKANLEHVVAFAVYGEESEGRGA